MMRGCREEDKRRKGEKRRKGGRDDGKSMRSMERKRVENGLRGEEKVGEKDKTKDRINCFHP